MSRDFPEGFLFGAATSAHQIEGSHDLDGRGESVWDVFARVPGAIEGGGDASKASGSYLRWRDDVDLLERMNLGAYRFSIGWSRVLPNGTGHVEQRGLDHYERIIDALLERGIAPFVTLNHWDMPQALLAHGGWTGRSTVDAFAEFTTAVADRLADRVEWWIPQNEPWIIALLGYQLGLHAPGIADLRSAVTAGHHVLLGHGVAADILHEQPGVKVGSALSLFPCDPATDSDEDRAAASGSDGYVNRWYLDPLLGGGYPRDMWEHWERATGTPLDGPDGFVRDGDEALIAGRSDFLGVNFYTRRVMAASEPRPFPWRVVGPSGDVTRTDEGWEVVPDSLRDLLLRIERDYPGTPVVITENGAVSNEAPTHDGRVHDVRRIAYLRGHLAAVAEAIRGGADVRGYLHWSLLDNFEWSLGYRPRFGLTHVDYATGTRTLKDSGLLYAEIARTGSLSVPDPAVEAFG